MKVLHGKEAEKARELARLPLSIKDIVRLQEAPVEHRRLASRTADFYAGIVPDFDEKTVAWRKRWTAAYSAACWVQDQGDQG